ncbi:hydroxysqualene dehydroxylase HpnE [Massilia sp. 9096]|uniref:hydroxysqualene dehydroxylase HpnE n=1 Tax=Massilia sp. 9096 TaxID=1500894 RepID=UPI00056068DD|nr:hydroxysqualene dehydroxylase HpnE [Massilia sp. 9096]
MSATKTGTARRSVAVIGGGWAGCAAALELSARGCEVTLHEAARALGGRARAVQARGRVLDNGQHILLGAYRDSLGLMRRVGLDPNQTMLRLPLQMRYPPAAGHDAPALLDFAAPRLPAPLHVLVALLRAQGLERADKLALARFTTSARWMDWHLKNDCSVIELLERFDQTPRLYRLLWRPLCIAALNTDPAQASARVFLAVLRDSLGAKRAASDMLLPRVLLDELFPQAARRHLEAAGARVLLGSRVESIAPLEDGGWSVRAGGVDARYDAVVLATAPWQSASLLRPLAGTASLVGRLEALAYEPICTVYLQYAPGTRLPLPFCALLDDPDAGAWGQFAFDRGQLDASQDGLLAVVVSSAGRAIALEQALLAEAVARQLAEAFGNAALGLPAWTQVIAEKRATFACTPDLDRPGVDSGPRGLLLAGDYTASDYPATLESAVRSGLAAALAAAPAKGGQ